MADDGPTTFKTTEDVLRMIPEYMNVQKALRVHPGPEDVETAYTNFKNWREGLTNLRLDVLNPVHEAIHTGIITDIRKAGGTVEGHDNVFRLSYEKEKVANHRDAIQNSMYKRLREGLKKLGISERALEHMDGIESLEDKLEFAGFTYDNKAGLSDRDRQQGRGMSNLISAVKRNGTLTLAQFYDALRSEGQEAGTRHANSLVSKGAQKFFGDFDDYDIHHHLDDKLADQGYQKTDIRDFYQLQLPTLIELLDHTYDNKTLRNPLESYALQKKEEEMKKAA